KRQRATPCPESRGRRPRARAGGVISPPASLEKTETAGISENSVSVTSVLLCGKRIGRRAPANCIGHTYSALKRLNRRAGAEEIAVAVNIVDARDDWPEFVFARPRRGESGLFARVRIVPSVGCDLPRGVWRVFEQIILSILFSR